MATHETLVDAKDPERRYPDDDAGAEPDRGAPFHHDLVNVDHHDMSLAAIMKGTAAVPMTVFERKAALINLCVVFFCCRRSGTTPEWRLKWTASSTSSAWANIRPVFGFSAALAISWILLGRKVLGWLLRRSSKWCFFHFPDSVSK